MKGLNKIALATAVAVAPFATQAMEPMNDDQMGDVTGQAGVTIELETSMTIDQVAYSQDTNGSFLMDDIRVGGFEDGESLDLAIDIDLEDSGDAVISLGSLDEGVPVALGMDIGSMGLDGDDGSATLISGMEMDMYLSQLDITAKVEDLDGEADGSGSLDIDVNFAIDNLDIEFDVAAVELQGFRMAGAGSLDTLQEANQGTGASVANPAVAQLSIGAGDSLSGERDDVLRIELDSFQADMWMPTINVGGESVGSVAISNLNVTDTTMAIYGRD